MTIGCGNKKTSTLINFLKTIRCTDMQLQLLSFWRQHPKTRLGTGTMAKIMGVSPEMIVQEMSPFVDNGLITRHDIGNGMITYSLALQEIEYVCEFINMDWEKIVQRS